MSGLLPSRLKAVRLHGAPPRGQHRHSGHRLQLNLGRPGTCPEKPQIHISIFDDSLSMLGGNDSTGYRYAETAVTLEQIGRRCRCGRELVAILHMSHPTSADRPPTPLKGRGWQDLTSGLRVPADSDGASLLRPTLHQARQLVDDHPDHEPTLIVFSDFELFDDNLPRLWTELSSFPAKVHAIVLRSRPPQALVNDGSITVTKVPYGLPPGAVAAALFSILITPRLNSR